MFGIDEIGVEIEDPFGYDPNDLPMDRIAEVIKSDAKRSWGAWRTGLIARDITPIRRPAHGPSPALRRRARRRSRAVRGPWRACASAPSAAASITTRSFGDATAPPSRAGAPWWRAPRCPLESATAAPARSSAPRVRVREHGPQVRAQHRCLPHPPSWRRAIPADARSTRRRSAPRARRPGTTRDLHPRACAPIESRMRASKRLPFGRLLGPDASTRESIGPTRNATIRPS